MLHKQSTALAVLTVLTILMASCQSNATPTLAALPGPGIGVGITDDTCPAVTVKAGQQIGWTNQGKQDHIVRAQSTQGESQFASGVLKPGESFTINLTVPDTFKYECSEDGSLRASITVEP